MPDITVAISTRNRGSEVLRTVETILASDYPSFDVLVVDQSDDGRTRDALAPFLGRPRFQYKASARRGLAAGRNEGIAGCQSEFIAMTDDDCEVETGWLREMVNAFLVNERIGVVFGNVIAGAHDKNLGFIPAYSQPEPYLATSITAKHRIEGIGASMGIRRSTWRALDGFDENFGAGSRFCSAEELDFTVRALLRGYAAYAAPAARVIHHGFRSWESGQALIWGYLYGIGGMFGKLLRAGEWPVVVLMGQLGWRWAFGGPVVDLGHKPPRGLRLKAFFRGFVDGFRIAPVRGRGRIANG
jgi:GT2 family glycosyltransferase